MKDSKRPSQCCPTCLPSNPFQIPKKINSKETVSEAVANSGENFLPTIPLSLINKNVFITGSVGTGKTTSAILHGFKLRKQRISF